MIKAVFLDMDDTLVRYPNGGLNFVAHYLGKMENTFGDAVPDISKHLIQAVQEMIGNVDPRQRNMDFYWQTLAKLVDDLPALQTDLNAFYATEYPRFQALTEPDPHAAPLVQALIERGYMVVIATNPMYPRNVIEERLRWAGIEAGDVDLARITHAENSHFTKPHPHYYEEICAHLDIEPYQVMMVGDNWQNDIKPAYRAGMRTFWIEHNQRTPPQRDILTDGRGSLADFKRCVLDEDWLDRLPARPVEISQIAPRMLGNIGALWGTLEPIEAHYWHQRPDLHEWTPIEVVAHLAENEIDVQRPRLQRIASEDNPFLPPEREPFQPLERDFSGVDGWALAHQFADERDQTLAFLRGLPAEAWQRPARHSTYGPTTLLEMAVLTTRHDHLHIRQLCQTIGKCT